MKRLLFILLSAPWLIGGYGYAQMTINGVTVTISAGAAMTVDGTVSNAGTVAGSGTLQSEGLANSGVISPGLSPGQLSLMGPFQAMPVGRADIELFGLGGPGAANGHDQVVVGGHAELNGELNVTLGGAYTAPAAGDQFIIMTYTSRAGTFSSTNLPALPSNLSWNLEYRTNDVLLEVICQPIINSCPANLIVCSNGANNKANVSNSGPGAISLASVTALSIGNCPVTATYTRSGASSNAAQPAVVSFNGTAYEISLPTGLQFNVGATTVNYTVSSAAGLTATCSFRVTVRKSPNPFWQQTALSICNGASINLASYARDGRNTAKRYNFYKGDANGDNLVFQGTVTATNGNVNFGQNRTVLPPGNNSTSTVHYYYLTAVNTFASGPNCEGSLSGALVVTVNPTPALTATLMPVGQICPGTPVSITYSSSIPATVYWSNSNTGIGLAANGTGNISFNAAAPGMATIFAQASSGACGSAPVSTALTVSSCNNSRMLNAGEDPKFAAVQPQVYPNPTRDLLFVRLPDNGDQPQLYESVMVLYDALGRQVLQANWQLSTGQEQRTSLAKLPVGVYSYQLRIGQSLHSGWVEKL